MHCNNKDTVTSSLGLLGLHFDLNNTARANLATSQRLAVRDVEISVVPSIVTYKIYYVLETVPVVQKNKHFDKEHTLPHKFELNHYLNIVMFKSHCALLKQA